MDLSTSTRCQPEEVIEDLFAALHAKYGTRFADMWANPYDPKAEPEKHAAFVDRVKQQWGKDLAGMTRAELRQGLRRCPPKWPPDAPEFALLCRPAPDYEALYLDAVRQLVMRREGRDMWRHAAQYWAASTLVSEMRSQTYATMRMRWKEALDDAFEKVRSGELSPIIPARDPVALAAPGQNYTDDETAHKKLAEIMALLRKGKKPDDTPDSDRPAP